jgi:hypothetical protein
VLPSLGIALRMVPTPASQVHFTLVAEVVNYLRNVDVDVMMQRLAGSGDDFAFDRERLSSVGQLDLPAITPGEEHIDIDENGIKVMGLWSLGAGVPFKYKARSASTSASTSASASSTSGTSATAPGLQASPPDLLVCPSERIARCFPVKLAASAAGAGAGARSQSARGKCSWLLPMPSSSSSATAAAPASASGGSAGTGTGATAGADQHLVRVIEQFLCIANGSARFERDIEHSRVLVKAAELEAETKGPRTITQLRREKLRELEKSGLLLGAAVAAAGGPAGGAAAAADVQVQEMAAAVSAGSASSAAAPKSAQDLADYAAARSSLIVAAVWACRWEGKLRWGMHKISSLSFVGEAVCAAGGDELLLRHAEQKTGGAAGSARAVSPTASLGVVRRNSVGASSLSGKLASDYLLVGLCHAPTCELDAAQQCSVDVPVTLKLRSLSTEPLSVTVCAEDHTNDEADRHMQRGPHYVYNDDPEHSLEKVVNCGMRWNGKTQHIGILVEPQQQQEITLSAVFTKTGVFDLNRYSFANLCGR